MTLVRLVAYSDEPDHDVAVDNLMRWANENGWHVTHCAKSVSGERPTFLPGTTTYLIAYELWVEA